MIKIPPPTLLQYNQPLGFQQPRNFAPTHTNNPPLSHPSSSTQNLSLEDLVKVMATSSMQFQQITQAFIKNLKLQMGQMAKEIGEIKAHGSGKLSS